MNDNNKKDIIFLENFFKKNKDNALKIKQPIKINNFDIFEEEEKVEKPRRKSTQKLRSVNNTYGVIQKKYNIVKESTIFQELDTKKSFHLLSNLKNHYKNFLFDTISRNKSLNNEKYNTTRNDNYLRQKSSLNLSDQYEIKLKNVRKIKYNLFIYIKYLYRMKYIDLY